MLTTKIVTLDNLTYYNNKISNYVEGYVDEKVDGLVNTKQDKIDDLDEIRAGAAKGATALQSVPSEYVTETELSNKGYATISALNNKVDAINGKQLSTEDFTTALKTKLEGLNNYDDTELSEALSTLRGDFDNIVSGDTTTAIKTFNEVIAFLDGLTDTQDLESIIASIEQQIAGKMNKVTLATVATSGNYNDLTNKPTIPTKTSELENDSNYIVVDEYGDASIDGTMWCNQVSCDRIATGDSDIGLKFDDEGIYTDIAGGIKLLSITNTGDGTKYLADDGTYKTVSGGSGTITGVSANGTSIATSGVANIPAASTSKYGVTKLSSSTSSTSTSLAATASAVKAAYDLANGKQDKLTSGTNIKTINGTSILGSGDITISGGSSNANVQAVDTGDVLDDVTVNYATKTYVDGKVANIDLTNYATTAYVDGLIGDINSVLESIINGGGNVSIFPITLSYNVDGNETYAKVYAELDKISNKNLSSVPIDTGLIYIDLTTFAIGITEKSYEVSHIMFEGDNTYSLGTIKSGPEMHIIMLSSNGTVWCLSQ